MHRQQRQKWPQSKVKRVLDVVASGSLVILTLPLLGLAALAVRILDGSPVFFTQERIGFQERPFRLMKLRTMTHDDDDGQPEQEVTRLGRSLRATSIDELPQLMSILRGDMSFVGPRPLLPEYLPHYDHVERRRHEVRPGLTGLAQVNGRNALSWERRLALDVEYVDNATLVCDLRLLVRSFVVVLQQRDIDAGPGVTMQRLDAVRSAQQ